MLYTMIAVGFLMVFALVGLGVIISLEGDPEYIYFLVIGAGVIGAVFFYFISKDYKAEFKQQIIRRIVRFINPDLYYRPKGLINEHTFKGSKLFTHHIDRYAGEDMVRGRIDRTDIMFSEVHAEYKSGSGKDKTWHTIFKGLFFIADFNKHFYGQTLVLPDSAEKLFGGFGKMLQEWNIGRPDLIKLEDPEFEREFVVYGNDQIESRYILSTSLMRQILEFKRKTGFNIYLSFVGSKVYVAVPTNQDMFEPKCFFKVDTFDPVFDYFRDISFAVDIVDDLNLNTRIWSKE